MIAVRATALGLIALATAAHASPSHNSIWAISASPSVIAATHVYPATHGSLLAHAADVGELLTTEAWSLARWMPAFADPASRQTFADPAPTDSSAGVIPPPPSSRSLALSGLAAAAGLQLLRRIHLPGRALLPDWYATSGPHQVGHATPLVLGCESAAWPVLPALYASVQPPARPACGWYLHPEPEEAPLLRLFLSPTAPRGPPSHAHAHLPAA